MAQVINTNSLSLMAQNNLNKSQSSLGTAIERLSSGLRINSAKDDAAGQAISNRFTANIKGLTQASRNANDGISLAQTTEGALNEVNDNLQNIRRLTVQAQNGSNSKTDLQSIQDEITERLSEIDRISQQTDFNGVKVLSKDQSLTIQVGANDGETISIDLSKVDAKSLSLDTFNVTDMKNKVGDKVTSVSVAGTADKTVTPTLGNVTNGSAGSSLQQYQDSGTTKYAVLDGGKYYEVDVDPTTGKAADIDISAAKEVTGKTSADFSAAADITIKGSAGSSVKVSGLNAGEELHKFDDGTGTDKYLVKTTNANGEVIYKNADVDTTTGVVTTKTENTDVINPLKQLDDALQQVDQLRSSLGAVQNRFDSVINNLNSTVNNLSASQSRIQDADYATEVSNMSRANILQQAGTSVLAQANQSTQNVLSLLR
ncbi:FliC/FljB family flagellin [Klebsiella aerogenes]|uniref:FliC/FljB family flagellin n=1 Tax=Klebsiella aerogenes TaxID=548 RepID=UPI0023B892E1|nr:FliC/FljB family flagellin [Klebsiella aerogenes]ELA1888267.1 FliC/FljB family flagellin [Klebsiella aerogenes]MDF0549135.1 FliC/FljB family flagellin [Klebsiella aerogenes]